ncbi:DUF4386 domain-containing protein [Falsiroseomonas selenitidurans]|uniref:DUF4386 domain-containing protein n=1 Tax=Falsiroseomonas selenitidurans TaxID=2716335 RepID=A0ABX1E8V8_9PROT|nr:DUF4386 domain-containing protein [Falsiroseomonas selenitidurans]NKC31942.1 DUF4386 domain-containing protein [Falsiroseomonas selenitidurans]
MIPGLALILLVLVLNAAFTVLSVLFGYDDVLRLPPGEVMARFHAAGPALVVAWIAFAAGALAFAWIGPMAERRAGLSGQGWLAPAAALAMAAGLLRWVVAVPVLAAAHQAPGATEVTQVAMAAAYIALHQFAGAGVGEVLGQVLLCAWTLRLSLALAPRQPWLAAFGLLLLPLWLLGLSEPLAAGLPALPVVEAAPIAFMAWEAWLVAIGLAWIVAALRPASPATA